ncbi:FtsX-like permease family protein [Bifidobacterium biavatii]|nr:FtsX-like permease family protein [Bifidobacterium biavatii]
MSAAFAKDTLRCWLRGWKRFVSIAVISLLGVAVLTGIYAGCRDMFLAADRFYDAQGLHDIQVMSTLGLTDDDVAALKSIDGVAVVQPERSQSVETKVDGTAKTVTLTEIGTAGLDQPYLQDGRMPAKSGEIAVTKKFLMDSGLAIGDKLTVTPADETTDEATDASDDNDATDSANGAAADATGEQAPRFPTKLTIVGEVLDPKDVSNPDGIGSKAFRQTLASDYTFFAPSDGVTGDIYTAISITVTGAADTSSFGSDYDDMVRTVAERIEHKVQTSRQQARRQQLVDTAQAKLDDAKTKAAKQFADAQAKLDKNSADLLTGRNELETNRRKLDENDATIKDGEQQIKDAREQIAQAKQQIDDGRAQIKTARAQLDAGNAQLTSARAKLNAAQAELTDKRKPIDAGIAQTKQGIATIDGTVATIGSLTDALNALPSVNGSGSAHDDDSDSVSDSGKSGAADDAGRDTVVATRSNGTSNSQWTQLRKQLAAFGINAPQAQPDQAGIAAIIGQLDAQRSSLATQRAQLAQQRDQLAATLNNTIIPAQTQLDQQNEQLVSQELKAADSNAKLNQQSKQLDANEAKLDEQSKELDKQETELKDGRKQLEDGRKQLKAAETKLADGEKQLTAAQAKLDRSKQQASDEFDRQQQRVDDIAEARWYVQTRSAIGGFSAIKSDLSSIESIGRAFPVVFLLVAVLMSLTTMTRMVEEERGLIGTYVGLGYGPVAIGARYVLFAALACLIGGGLGLIAGFIGIPAFLLVVLQGLYTVPGVRFEYDWLYGSAGIALFVVGIVAATAVACAGELRLTPAELMRPKAPRAGSRVLLERIGPLWRRMKFLNKVTVRNLVRFKSRLIMTVGGVAGCTALIVCGLAISDTVDALPVTQYRDVYRYDLMVVTDHDHVASMLERLNDDGTIGGAGASSSADSADSSDGSSDGSAEASDASGAVALARIENGEITTGMDETETVQIVTVPDEAALNRIVDLRSAADGSPIRLSAFEHGRPDGVIVAQSAANALGVRAGDQITLKNGEAQRKQVRVAAVSRSVIGSDVYVTAGDYARFFGGTADGGDAVGTATDATASGGASADSAQDSTADSTNGDGDSSEDVTSADSLDTVVDGVQMNAIFAQYDGSDDEQIAYAERLGKDANVLSVASTADLQRSFSFDLMGAVVALIVALAGGLALVVLFTLANTNVSERVREMATLKVLGFFDREVHRYVNREMLILTVLGVVVGLPVGRWVGGLLTAALAMPGIYFEVSVRWQSYAIAAAVTMVFALLVQFFTNPVLDRIDPVSSPKSVE